MSAVKEEVRQLADALADDATWDDVMEQVYLKQVVAAGLKASAEGRSGQSQRFARATAFRDSRWKSIGLNRPKHTSPRFTGFTAKHRFAMRIRLSSD